MDAMLCDKAGKGSARQDGPLSQLLLALKCNSMVCFIMFGVSRRCKDFLMKMRTEAKGATIWQHGLLHSLVLSGVARVSL